MNLREIIDIVALHEKAELFTFTTYTGLDVDLRLLWNPTPNEAMGAIRRSEDKILRVLLDGQDIICWDAYYVEHRDVAKLIDKPELMRGRKCKLYIAWHATDQTYAFEGGEWGIYRDEYLQVPAIERLIKAGFKEGY